MGQFVRVSSHTLKGCIPGVQVLSLVGHVQKATNRCFSLTLIYFFSFSAFPYKNSKHIPGWGLKKNKHKKWKRECGEHWIFFSESRSGYCRIYMNSNGKNKLMLTQNLTCALTDQWISHLDFGRVNSNMQLRYFLSCIQSMWGFLNINNSFCDIKYEFLSFTGLIISLL